MKTEFINIVETMKKFVDDTQELSEKVEMLNYIKEQMHEISPFADQPADCVIWVKQDDIVANDYNPNKVAPPEMALLYDSIKCDGYTQPIVTGTPTDKSEETKKYIVTDGYHRNLISKKHKDICKKVYGYLPVTVLKGKTLSELMASTIRHNRARGSHDVNLMSNIVAELHDLGRSDEWIAKHLEMDLDEILRLKQLTGLTELFQDQEFSKAWEPIE